MPQPQRNNRSRLPTRSRKVRRQRPCRFETLESRTLLAADIATGLAHHWRFDETSGDTAADSAGGSDGSLVNWNATEPKWEPGRVGGALRFGTADNYVIAQPPAMSGSYAVSFWLNVTDRSGTNPRVFQSKAGGDIFLWNSASRGVGIFAGNGVTADPNPPTFNTWEHYAVNFNAATDQGVVFRGGAPVAIGQIVDTTSLATWVIGHSSNLANHSDTLSGFLDDLRVYNRVLTDEDIALLASQGIPEPVHQEPVHHWTFDETTGFTANDTAGGADGTLLNWNAVEPRWEPGKIGGALRFSTADNAVVTSAVSTRAQWSVAFWLNVAEPTGVNPRVVEPWAYVNWESNRGVSFASRNTSTFDPAPLPLDQWVHYTITFDTLLDAGTIYRNGIAVASGFFGDNAPAAPLVFGHQSDLGNHNDSLNGLLDDLRVYDRLVSTTEIAALVAMGNAPQLPAGLVHHWPFDETTGDTALDIASGSDGTLVNWNATEPKWEPGRVGGALRFSTADNYVIAQPPAMSGSYAVSFWLNVTDRSGTNPRILSSRAGNFIALNYDSSRGVGYYYAGSQTSVADPSWPTFNTWEHYVINFNAAGQGVVYRRGAPVAVGAFADSASLASWVFGHSSDLANTTDSLQGALDDLRVYDRLLSDDDIALLGSLGTPEPVHAEPVHHWTFDETSGNTARDIAGGADGILLNWGATEPKWVAGKVGGALQFTTNDNAVITTPASVHAKWSVAFWAQMTARTSLNPRVIGPQDGRELWAYFDVENNGSGAFLSHNQRTFEAAAMPLGTWEHFVFTYDTDADLGTIYHNGVSVKSGPFHDNPTTQPWVFGHNVDQGNHNQSLNGLLDDLRVYDRLLAPSEIAALAGVVVAAADSYTTNEDAPLAVSAANGVLVNDSGSPGPPLTAAVAAGPAHGTLALSTDGGFTYTPAANYNGPDSFTYRASDGSTSSAPGTVSISIAAVNDRPSFTKGPNQAATDEQTAIVVSNWATNLAKGPPTATDEAVQQLTFTVASNNPSLFSSQPAIDASGRLTYTPAPNVRGTAVVTVTLRDNGGIANGGADASAPQSFTITIDKPQPWHNSTILAAPQIGALDVNADGSISPIDAVLVINYLNSGLPGAIPANAPVGGPNGIGPGITAFLDTGGGVDGKGDNNVSPIDAVLVINWLNSHPVQAQAVSSANFAESDANGEFDDEPSAWADLISFLALDVATQPKRRRY